MRVYANLCCAIFKSPKIAIVRHTVLKSDMIGDVGFIIVNIGKESHLKLLDQRAKYRVIAEDALTKKRL